MITLDHEVLCSDEQMEFIIEGMRNPMNSWAKSDSHPGYFYYNGEEKDCENCTHIAPDDCNWRPYYILGKNDLKLMNKLAKAGKDHRKYMRMIPVMIRITAPLYWWKEFDTYKIGTVANSTSTMHKITAKEFTREDFSTDMLTNRSLALLDDIIDLLNYYRGIYLNGGDDCYCDSDNITYKPKDKKVWYQLIQMLPDSYNQTRNVFFNYEVLANIYQGRRNHKLKEWHVLCDWIEALPWSHLITGKEPNNLEIDAEIAGEGHLHVASPTNSYTVTDPIEWETIKSFPKAKPEPNNFENTLDDIKHQGKSIGDVLNDITKDAMNLLSNETDKKIIETALFLSPVAMDIMHSNADNKEDDKDDSYTATMNNPNSIVSFDICASPRPNIADMPLSDIYKNFRLHNEDSDNGTQRDCNC